MAAARLAVIVFIDFEASSLGKGGFPIDTKSHGV
jgi:hypothetical protein